MDPALLVQLSADAAIPLLNRLSSSNILASPTCCMREDMVDRSRSNVKARCLQWRERAEEHGRYRTRAGAVRGLRRRSDRLFRFGMVPNQSSHKTRQAAERQNPSPRRHSVSANFFC